MVTVELSLVTVLHTIVYYPVWLPRLLQHVYDPTLDEPTPREYVVYACPGGDLGAQLDEFYDASLLQCGWNGSHKLFPHVTLCQFFKVVTSLLVFCLLLLCSIV